MMHHKTDWTHASYAYNYYRTAIFECERSRSFHLRAL